MLIHHLLYGQHAEGHCMHDDGAVHLFSQQIPMEHLLRARHWGESSKVSTAQNFHSKDGRGATSQRVNVSYVRW